MRAIRTILLVSLAAGPIIFSPSVFAGRYDGFVDISKRFNHVSPDASWKQLDNSLGGHTTITNKPTVDPSYPGQRFESFQMTNDSGKVIGKDTYIYDHNGKINAIK